MKLIKYIIGTNGSDQLVSQNDTLKRSFNIKTKETVSIMSYLKADVVLKNQPFNLHNSQ